MVKELRSHAENRRQRPHGAHGINFYSYLLNIKSEPTELYLILT